MRAVGGSSERICATIIGGGVAGLEAMLALRDELGEDVEVNLHAPRREFRYRPLAVGEPFDAGHVLTFDLGDLARRAGARFHLGSVLAVDGERRQVFLHDGERVHYDFLLIAPGTRMVMGLPGAITFWGVADEGGVPSVIRALRSGELRHVVFTTPGSGWPLPAYELALLAASDLERAGVEGASLTVVTPEEAPLGVFGSRVSDEVSRLLEERGVGLVAGAHPVEFDGSRLRVAPGDPVQADAVITVPRLEGRRIAGVRRDESGFVPIDDHVRVLGMERVFAAGDVTTFPVKQGGIAAQQALGNVFAGLVLLFARPFQVGDAVRLRAGALGGTLDGIVTDIGITYVRFDTDGSVMSIPNSQVLNAVVGPIPPDEDDAPEEEAAPDGKSGVPGGPEHSQPRPGGPT